MARILAVSSLFALQQGCTEPQVQTAVTPGLETLRAATPFQDNNGALPPRGDYSGPMFVLNHAWPEQQPPPLQNPPWRAAIGNGTINTGNAAAYADALRSAISANARTLIMDYPAWNAASARWYNEPWLGTQRESIHGTYEAGSFGPAIFPGTGLRATFNTHVLTYYDERAATALRNVWGASAMNPTLTPESAQFPEGSIIVKVALFASQNPSQPQDWWDAMRGAQIWPLYVSPGPGPEQVVPPVPAPARVWPGYVAQFDIIVKDSASSPETGWVYMTLVYDNRVAGDAWDRMIPLGVQWGNDPQAVREGMALQENWINPAAPLYATQTLGWGGRLSGPNDGARNAIAIGGSPDHDGQVLPNAPNSSCMSCHSAAQWNVAQHRMVSFILPSFSTTSGPGFLTCGNNGRPDPNGNNICSPAPGSELWMKWFQNRPGDQPMDAGSVATDFDMVFAFKSLRLWWAATGPANQPVPMLVRTPAAARRYNLYNGAPLPNP
jgi:hypothetical protein